jgi:hypothetical protein
MLNPAQRISRTMVIWDSCRSVKKAAGGHEVVEEVVSQVRVAEGDHARRILSRNSGGDNKPGLGGSVIYKQEGRGGERNELSQIYWRGHGCLTSKVHTTVFSFTVLVCDYRLQIH